MQLKLDGAGAIAAVRFKGVGCAISLASASMLTEMIERQTLDFVKHLDKDAILKALGVTELELGPSRIKCALLGLKVLKAAVYQYEAKESGGNR